MFKWEDLFQIWQLILAWALADIAGAYAPVIATSLYSKALGQRKQVSVIWMIVLLPFSLFRECTIEFLRNIAQGLWMGILASVNSLARGIGPVTTGLIYTKYGSYATYGTCIASLAGMWPLLAPHASTSHASWDFYLCFSDLLRFGG